MQVATGDAFYGASQAMLDGHGVFGGQAPPAAAAAAAAAAAHEAQVQQLQALQPEDMEPEAVAEYLEALRAHKAEVRPGKSGRFREGVGSTSYTAVRGGAVRAGCVEREP